MYLSWSRPPGSSNFAGASFCDSIPRSYSILRSTRAGRTITALRQPLPEPKRGRGVTISYGAYPATSFKIEGARIVEGVLWPEVLGQFVYTGGYECQPDSVSFEATMFNAAGQIIGISSDSIFDPAQDVRYPLELSAYFDEKPVRAELVMTRVCCPF